MKKNSIRFELATFCSQVNVQSMEHKFRFKVQPGYAQSDTDRPLRSDTDRPLHSDTDRSVRSDTDRPTIVLANQKVYDPTLTFIMSKR